MLSVWGVYIYIFITFLAKEKKKKLICRFTRYRAFAQTRGKSPSPESGVQDGNRINCQHGIRQSHVACRRKKKPHGKLKNRCQIPLLTDKVT